MEICVYFRRIVLVDKVGLELKLSHRKEAEVLLNFQTDSKFPIPYKINISNLHERFDNLLKARNYYDNTCL